MERRLITQGSPLNKINIKNRNDNKYREALLKMHGMICAKCARKFDYKSKHMLTVHHKDGNPQNKPPDGSNWEKLCVYCHNVNRYYGVGPS